MKIDELINQSEGFNYPIDKKEQDEKDRLEFVSKFPLESLLDMDITQYCQYGTFLNPMMIGL